MKIDSQSVPLPTQSAAYAPERDEGFEQLLHSPTKQTKDGDYYWQHQDQLQQSALTFYSLNHNVRIAKEINGVMKINEPTNCPIDEANLEVAQHQIRFETETNAISRELNSLSDCELNELVTLIKKTIEALGNSVEQKPNDKPIVRSIKQQEISSPSALPDAVLKNHQLFLNNNAAELSLNTSRLSTQEASELKKLIKKWLINKGFTLKQLVINGELQ